MDSLQNQIESLLGTFWDDRNISLENNPISIDDLGTPLDSLTACEAMIEIDDLIGKTIPVEVIVRNGGYESRDQFIQHVTEGVLTYLKGNE